MPHAFYNTTYIDHIGQCLNRNLLSHLIEYFVGFRRVEIAHSVSYFRESDRGSLLAFSYKVVDDNGVKSDRFIRNARAKKRENVASDLRRKRVERGGVNSICSSRKAQCV